MRFSILVVWLMALMSRVWMRDGLHGLSAKGELAQFDNWHRPWLQRNQAGGAEFVYIRKVWGAFCTCALLLALRGISAPAQAGPRDFILKRPRVLGKGPTHTPLRQATTI